MHFVFVCGVLKRDNWARPNGHFPELVGAAVGHPSCHLVSFSQLATVVKSNKWPFTVIECSDSRGFSEIS